MLSSVYKTFARFVWCVQTVLYDSDLTGANKMKAINNYNHLFFEKLGEFLKFFTAPILLLTK